jgi:hypothetical protein
VIALVGESSRHPVGVVVADGGLRDDHADGSGLFEDAVELGSRTEHACARSLADVVIPDEAEDSVPQLGIPGVGVQQTDGVGIGADDHDRTRQPAALAELTELRSGDSPLGEKRRERSAGEEDDPQPGELLELHQEGDAQQGAHSDGHRSEDVAGLLGWPFVRASEVQSVDRGTDRETGKADDPRAERVASPLMPARGGTRIVPRSRTARRRGRQHRRRRGAML